MDPETRADAGGRAEKRSGVRGAGIREQGSRGCRQETRVPMASVSGVTVGCQFTWLPVGTVGLPHLALVGLKVPFPEINDNNNIEICQGPLYLLPHNHSFIQSANTSLNQTCSHCLSCVQQTSIFIGLTLLQLN